MPGWFTSLHPAVQVAFIIAGIFIVPPMLVFVFWIIAALCMGLVAILTR